MTNCDSLLQKLRETSTSKNVESILVTSGADVYMFYVGLKIERKSSEFVLPQ